VWVILVSKLLHKNSPSKRSSFLVVECGLWLLCLVVGVLVCICFVFECL